MKTPKGPFLAACVVGATLVLAAAPRAEAAVVITADGGSCTLANAILTANTLTNTGGCIRVGATSIDRVIELTYDVTIAAKDPTAGDDEDEEYGANALPAITCHLTINAHGKTIQRDPALFAPPDGDGLDPCSGGEHFRIFMVDYPGGTLTLNDAAVKNGCAGDAYGGGGLFYLGHEMTLNRVLVANNRAGMGGGIFQHESTLTVNDSTVTGNAALAGGGTYSRTGTQRVNNSLFVSNSAIAGSGNVCVDSEGQITCMPKGSGGAIALHGGGLVVTGATIAQSSATSGGVLYNSGATANLTGVTLFQNSAVNGGVVSNAGGTTILTSATAYQNSATGSGGVVYIFGGLAKIVHATAVGNSAASGGAVFVLTRSKSVTLSDTLLQNPAGGNCALGAPGAGVNSGGHNLSTDATCGLAGTGDHQNVPDLGLGSYTDDGSPADGRLPLLPASPAIDTGVADGTLVDQIGDPRIGNPDIGAVEYPRSARVWIGVKGKADYGLRVDLRAEVFVNGVSAGQGVLTNLTTGQPGFAGSFFYTVPLPAVDAPSGATIDLTISARRSCAGAGINTGTAQLWYNGKPIDSGPNEDAGSRVGATAADQTAYLFLRNGFALDPAPGPGGASKLSADAALNSLVPCSGAGRPYTPFGTWTLSVP